MSIILNVLFATDILCGRTNKNNLYFQANFLQIQFAENFTNEGVPAAVPPALTFIEKFYGSQDSPRASIIFLNGSSGAVLIAVTKPQHLCVGTASAGILTFPSDPEVACDYVNVGPVVIQR